MFKVIKIYEEGKEDLSEVFEAKEYETHTLDLSHILSADFDGQILFSNLPDTSHHYLASKTLEGEATYYESLL